MTERDENIICGIIVGSYLNSPEKTRLCGLVRAALHGSEAGPQEAREAYDAKAERVFQAVVYAYEGRADLVPEDLLTHGMVKRALKFRAARPAVEPREEPR